MNFNKKIGDLEESILSCLLQKPKLMENLIIDEKYFTKSKKLFSFMRSFYQRFGNFDLTLMYSLCKSKYYFVENIKYLLEIEVTPSLCLEYQKQLINLYEEEKMERWKINKIFDLANSLYCRNITTKDFKEEFEKVYNANKEMFDK